MTLSFDDYLQLMPKTELHCHFTSTMTATTLIRLAERSGVELPTTDPEALFDYEDLRDFLVAFRAAHRVLRQRGDFAEVAYDGVRLAAAGGLRYREYAINPQYFQREGIDYRTVLESTLDGLRAAQSDLGVGFRIVVAINRSESAAAAVELVELMDRHRYPEVVALGMDDLTPEGAEDPGRFREAYAQARRLGFRTTAHVGETDGAEPDSVRVALDDLRVDRIDHGYRVLDDPELVERARDRGIGFTTTPISTTVCSGWQLTPAHRIAGMIEAGLKVTVSTDDALFFRTDMGREYREGLGSLGVDADTAKRISRNGIDAAFCSPEEQADLHARFAAEHLALDPLLDRAAQTGMVGSTR
jgi:adenosine deaminase